jgi:ribosome-associated translation inhibitor RaiA
MSKSQREQPQTVASCEATVSDLEKQIQRHRERAEELVAARKASSYAARVLLDVEQSKVLPR